MREDKELIIAEALQTDEGYRMLREVMFPSDPIKMDQLVKSFWNGWKNKKRLAT